MPYEHQFYRTTLKGLFSLDLHACGTFSSCQRTGFRNLDDERIKQAREKGLLPVERGKSYRLPLQERVQRISALFEGLTHLEGGAKQALHYTDVAPVVVILAVTRGGNHVFGHVVGATARGLPELRMQALHEALTVFQDDILSDVHVGWTQGYLDDERARLEAFVQTPEGSRVRISHPRQAFGALITALREEKNRAWLD